MQDPTHPLDPAGDHGEVPAFPTGGVVTGHGRLVRVGSATSGKTTAGAIEILTAEIERRFREAEAAHRGTEPGSASSRCSSSALSDDRSSTPDPAVSISIGRSQ